MTKKTQPGPGGLTPGSPEPTSLSTGLPRNDDQPPGAAGKGAAVEVSPELFDRQPTGSKEPANFGGIPGPGHEGRFDPGFIAFSGAIAIAVARLPELPVSDGPPAL